MRTPFRQAQAKRRQKAAGTRSRAAQVKSYELPIGPYQACPEARARVQLELMGTQSLGWEGDTFNDLENTLTRTWLRSKAGTIAGGSSEVQLNIIAKQVLGLPD